MGCGASIPTEHTYATRTVFGKDTRSTYEKQLRDYLIRRNERPDPYAKVDVVELALQSSEQAAQYEGFVDVGYRWKPKDPESGVAQMKEEKSRAERITLCRIHELATGLRLGTEAGIRLTQLEDSTVDMKKALPIDVQQKLLERLAAQRLRRAPTPKAQQAAKQLRRRGSIRLHAGV
mmetsp:Transcript_5883/g.10633  ORF Transcript_5883/g.10633 Transcript_5883/m.10633 type:complete len:177 (+) Transcript_5883:72-602(+)